MAVWPGRSTGDTEIVGDPRRCPWRGRKHFVSSGDVERIGRPARHGRDETPHGAQLGSVARDGTMPRMSVRSAQNWPRLSPMAPRMALQVVDATREVRCVVEDLQDGSLIRVTTATGSDLFPVWSPDGRQLAYGSGGTTERRLSIIAADATGAARDLPCPGGAPFASQPTGRPTGRHLIVNTRVEAGGTGRTREACQSRLADERGDSLRSVC